MHTETGFLAEGLATLLTYEWLLPCVHPFMHKQAAFLAEGLATVTAPIWLLPSVRSLV